MVAIIKTCRPAPETSENNDGNINKNKRENNGGNNINNYKSESHNKGLHTPGSPDALGLTAPSTPPRSSRVHVTREQYCSSPK